MTGATEHPRKVLIVSADIGEGHDLPARAVAREFKELEPDAMVSIVNGLPAMGPILTKILRENSAFMFRWLPKLFDFQYRLFMDFAVTRWLAGRLLELNGRKGLYRLVLAHNPDVIVSTYPGTTQILGELRKIGKIKAPVYSSITDLAGLRFWAHPGVDMHFITHPESSEEVESIAGPGSVRWVKPPTNPEFLKPRDRAQARAALELTPDGTVIAVSGGGWGVGDVAGAVRAALSIEDATVLCLCGHNEGLKERITAQFGADPRLRVMGFTNQMGDVLASANALIHSSAGLTVLEAIIRGCPVISYGFGHGHVRVSNEAFERFGLAQVARCEKELPPALERALQMSPEPDGSFATRASTAELIVSNPRRTQPLPRWRVRAVRGFTTATAAMVLAAATFTSSAAYAALNLVGAANPVTHVTTPDRQVGVLVDASAQDVTDITHLICDSGMKISYALSSAPVHPRAVNDCGNDALPNLSDSGLVSWVTTSAKLRKLADMFGWGHRFLYATNGPSLAQWLIAHKIGGESVSGDVRVNKINGIPNDLRAGELVELRPKTLAAAVREIEELEEQLQDQHLHGVPVYTLLKDSGASV